MVGNINSLLIALSWARLMLSNVIWSSNNLENLKMSSLLGCCPLLRICHPNIKQIYVNEARETRGASTYMQLFVWPFPCQDQNENSQQCLTFFIIIVLRSWFSKLNNLTLNCFSLFFLSHSRLKMYLYKIGKFLFGLLS